MRLTVEGPQFKNETGEVVKAIKPGAAGSIQVVVTNLREATAAYLRIAQGVRDGGEFGDVVNIQAVRLDDDGQPDLATHVEHEAGLVKAGNAVGINFIAPEGAKLLMTVCVVAGGKKPPVVELKEGKNVNLGDQVAICLPEPVIPEPDPEPVADIAAGFVSGGKAAVARPTPVAVPAAPRRKVQRYKPKWLGGNGFYEEETEEPIAEPAPAGFRAPGRRTGEADQPSADDEEEE